KKRRHDQAAPGETRSTLQNQKQQHGISRMEKHINGMRPLRVQPEDLAIECMGEPRDGMPVRLFRTAKRPAHCLPRKPGPNLQIVSEVNLIVVIEKGSASDGVIKRQGSQNEQQT